jgi:phosphatidylinositol alpha-1,6-mannosyltransferase
VKAGLQLLLSYDFPPMGGGIARWMGELAKRYSPGTLVISTGQQPGDAAADQQLPNRVDRLPIASSRLRTFQGVMRWSKRVAAMATALSVEFIWCGNIKPASYPARWTKMRTGVPYGILLHGGDLLILRQQARQSQLKRRMARALLGSASVLVSNSTWTATLCRAVLEELGIEGWGDRVRTVALGTDPTVFRPGLDQHEVRRRYGLRGHRWLLSVARLTRHKGIDTGIQVLAQLAQDYPDLAYAVVGSGDQLPTLQKLAGALGVGDRVYFLPNMPDSDLAALYNCAEIYLGLSRTLDHRVEGFGIALVEASACGIPVVGGRTGGIPDAVREGETGLLVDPLQPDEIGAALRSLLDDRALASRLGTAGRRAVETFYNWNRVAAEIECIGHEYSRALRREAAL